MRDNCRSLWWRDTRHFTICYTWQPQNWDRVSSSSSSPSSSSFNNTASSSSTSRTSGDNTLQGKSWISLGCSATARCCYGSCQSIWSLSGAYICAYILLLLLLAMSGLIWCNLRRGFAADDDDDDALDMEELTKWDAEDSDCFCGTYLLVKVYVGFWGTFLLAKIAGFWGYTVSVELSCWWRCMQDSKDIF